MLLPLLFIADQTYGGMNGTAVCFTVRWGVFGPNIRRNERRCRMFCRALGHKLGRAWGSVVTLHLKRGRSLERPQIILWHMWKAWLVFPAVTFSGHCTVGAVASAWALAGLLVLYQTACGKEYCNTYKSNNNNVYQICRQPVDHKSVLYFVAFLAGLTRRKIRPARTKRANINPITLTLPVNRSPNWYTMSAIA